MRKSKNLDTSVVPKKYPNIAKIFTKEWFESEFKKEKEDMHLLARQFTYDENDRSSLHLIDHLEDYLATMQDEIKRNKKHFYDTLRHRDQYKSTLRWHSMEDKWRGCLFGKRRICNGQYNHFCNFVVFPLL